MAVGVEEASFAKTEGGGVLKKGRRKRKTIWPTKVNETSRRESFKRLKRWFETMYKVL